MADCLQVLSAGVANFTLAKDSGVFKEVKKLAAISSDALQETNIAVPTFDNITFDIPTIGESTADLQDVSGFDQGAAPTLDSDSLSLTKPTYDAVVAVVDLPHTSTPISDIQYRVGESFITVPNANPGPPPLDYPVEGLISLPPRPGVGQVPVPSMEPDAHPDMHPIETRVFSPSGLEPLEGLELPEYDPPDVEKLQWQERLHYGDDAALQAKLKELMQGNDEAGKWVSTVAQSILYDADNRKLPVEVKRRLDNIMTAAAGRNFSMPHGAVDAAVAEVAEAELSQSFDVVQSVGDEVYEAAINAVTQAVSRSLQVEQYQFKLYMRYIQQNLRVYRRNVALSAEIYNGLVQIYNRISALVRTQIEAYNDYIRAVSAENAAVSDGIGIQEALVRTFQARVTMFRADVGLRAKAAQMQQSDVRQQLFPLDEYRAELQGHLGNLRIAEQNINAFQQSIQAYSQQLDWYDDAIGAFETASDVAVSQISINDSKFDAYRRLWSAEQTRASAFRDYVSSSFSVFDEELQRYRQAARSQQDYLSNIGQAVNTSNQAIGAYSQMVSEMAQHAGDFNSAKIGYTSAKDSVEISNATSQMARESIRAEAAAQEARLDAAAEAAKLTAAGALAQASSSIFQVSVSAEGSADERISGRDSGSTRASVQSRKTFNQSCVETVRPARV